MLTGGRSSRFGSNKALHVWHGKTLLEHALGGLEGCAERFVVGSEIRNDGLRIRPVTQTNFQFYPDAKPFQGALFGMARALEVTRFSKVCITACDMPNLSNAYWTLLAELEGEVVIPENADGLLEPLAAIYDKSCLVPVQDALAREKLQLTGWHAGLNVRVVPWPELEVRFGADVFLNANRLSDLTH